MSEQVKDFVPEKREVKLRSGLVVTIIAPTNRWWFEWLIPKAVKKPKKKKKEEN